MFGKIDTIIKEYLMNFKKLFLLLLTISSASIISASQETAQFSEEEILRFLASRLSDDERSHLPSSVILDNKKEILSRLTPSAVCYLGMVCMDLPYRSDIVPQAIAYIYKENRWLIQAAISYYSINMPGQHLK